LKDEFDCQILKIFTRPDCWFYAGIKSGNKTAGNVNSRLQKSLTGFENYLLTRRAKESSDPELLVWLWTA
jgi:hypothetical protein